MAKTTKQATVWTLNESTAVITASANAEVLAENAYLEATETSDGNMAALLASIGHEAGKPATQVQIDAWKDISDFWCKAYMEARDNAIDILTAGRAWRRLVARIKAEKPQSAEAIRKQALREASKAADVANPKGKPEDVASPVDGAKAAAIVLENLSSMEKHLIAMVRAGEFAKAAMLVNDMAKAK